MEINIEVASDSNSARLQLFGPSDRHIRKLRKAMGLEISVRNGHVRITGERDAVEATADIINRMEQRLKERGSLNESDVDELTQQVTHGLAVENNEPLVVYSHKRVVEPLTTNQANYIKTMRKNDLTFCIGPAGTGKTYLAVAVAVSMLKRNQIRKIVLARPAVEAGEKLGFLPGDLQAKVNPYLRPLFDSLEDMMEFSQMRKFIEMDIIEVIPLAFMRGRTLNEAVVICDEAQNTSTTQMLMFLTRMGRGSKMIITGDVTQVDLERGQICGMTDAIETLQGIKGIGCIELENGDIIRHKLVQNIVLAYDKKK